MEYLPHSTIQDATMTGRERHTCTVCQATLVYQPWMTELKWTQLRQTFMLSERCLGRNDPRGLSEAPQSL